MQTAALQEESKKLIALLKANSVKLTSDVESLQSEIKKEYERVAKSFNAKSKFTHYKIREDFDIRLNSEILTVSERMHNVKTDKENEVIKL